MLQLLEMLILLHLAGKDLFPCLLQLHKMLILLFLRGGGGGLPSTMLLT